jgi:transcriptional antiterminator
MNYSPNAQVTDTEKRRSESSYEIYNDIKELDEALKTGNYFTTAAKFRNVILTGSFYKLAWL